MSSRAYDWNDLVNERVINDTLAGTPIVLALEGDSASFHVWKRDTINFSLDHSTGKLKDVETGSGWNWQGRSTEGILQGQKLERVQAYQEFWHSWKTFRPQTSQYIPKKKS
jgi:hypothetical protein